MEKAKTSIGGEGANRLGSLGLLACVTSIAANCPDCDVSVIRHCVIRHSSLGLCDFELETHPGSTSPSFSSDAMTTIGIGHRQVSILNRE